MAELVIPSQVFDKKHIQMPKGNVVDSDEEWDRCGKWMLHEPHGDLRFVDSAWTALQQLLADETLIMLKASTALMAKEGALIMCYTRPGKREAKRAATAIQKVVDFKGIMYYKLNKQTSQGIAIRFGNKSISIYMQTFRGGFYYRRNGVWVKDSEDSAENTVQIAKEFCKENFSGREDLPSEQKGRCFWNLPVNHQCMRNGLPRLFMLCGYEDEGDHLSEVDRVWLVAKQLLQEGLFVGITLVKNEDVHCAEVHLYVSQDCDVNSWLAACNRIFKEAFSRTVMYCYDETRKRKCINSEGQEVSINGFLFTSDGELYGRTKYSEEYLSGGHKDITDCPRNSLITPELLFVPFSN